MIVRFSPIPKWVLLIFPVVLVALLVVFAIHRFSDGGDSISIKPAEVPTESPVVAINNSLLDPNIRIGQDVFYIVSEEKRGFSIWMSDTAIGLVRIPDATTKIGVSRRPITEPLIFEPYELGTSVNIEEDSMSGRLGIAVLSIRFETARATVFCTLVRGTRDFSEGRALSCRL